MLKYDESFLLSAFLWTKMRYCRRITVRVNFSNLCLKGFFVPFPIKFCLKESVAFSVNFVFKKIFRYIFLKALSFKSFSITISTKILSITKLFRFSCFSLDEFLIFLSKFETKFFFWVRHAKRF